MSPTMQHDRSIQKICQAIVRKGDTPDTNIFIVSTGDRDRDNDTLDPNGWDLSAHKANPVMLYGHAHTELPIAKCRDTKVVNGHLQTEAQWPPPGVYPFADTVRELVQHGFIQSTSVGFRGIEWTPNAYGGRDYTRQQLIEISLVPIPSNPNVRMVKGVDTMQYKSWLGQSWRAQSKEDDMPYVEIDDEPYLELKDAQTDAFEQMCAQMLRAYEEMSSFKFQQLMRAQLSTLGPDASIAALVRGLTQQGVVPSQPFDVDMRSWTPEPFDVDEKELATTIARVVAGEVGRQTRAALNSALGRLD